MLLSSFVSFLALATAALARPAANHSGNHSGLAVPSMSYLYTVNITSGQQIELGETPAGQRTFQPVTGGTFSGPGLHGKVVGGLDHGLVDADGNFNPDVVYLLQTYDNCTILVTEKGHAPNLLLEFETACDEYDWLNSVVAYGMAAQVPGGISVNVWKVGLYSE